MRVQNLIPFLVGASAALCTPSAVWAQGATAAATRDGSHDMDFAVGRWRTDLTIIKDPFNHPDQVVHMTGTKVAHSLWNGKALIEEIEAGTGKSHWQGANLFLYNPSAHQWSQNYADSDTGSVDTTPGIGQWRDGRIEFYWQQKVGGRTLLIRGVWKDFTPTSHTYEVSRSDDAGRSWHPSFIARVTRAE